MNKHNLWIGTLIIFVLGFVIVNDGVQAQETKHPLIFEPIYPENQNPQTKGYFDLSVVQGEKQTVYVKITNQIDKEITVGVQSANAYTNPVGGIIYEKNIESPNTKLLDDAIRMADHLEVRESVTISPYSSIEVPIVITVPQSEGQTLLGGVLFTTKGEETQQQQEVEEGTANFVLKTEIVNAVAIQLNLPSTVPPNFSLGKAGFIPETAEVFIEMTNDVQKIQEEIKGVYSVSNQQGEELFNGEFGPFKLAPKSKIRYPFQWGNETIEDGTYTLRIEGTTSGQKIKASEEFTINNEDMEKYVEKTQPNNVITEEKGISIWVWFTVAILFGLIMFLLGRRKK